MIGFRRFAALLLASLALLTGVTACATRPPAVEPDLPGADPASAFPAKVQVAGQQPVTITQQPKHIVSLSPTATETLYAIGAGDQVVAADKDSTFPQQAPRTELSSLNADPAAVAAQNPDLVIAPDSAGPLAEGLRAADVPVVLTPSAGNLDDAYRQIEALGRATGHTTQARQLTDRMRAEISRIVERTPKPPRPLSYYHEVSPDGYTATSRSFVGEVYGLFGMTNIADEAEGKFPQLSPEQVLRANPDLVFLSDTKCCQVSPEAASARPGWNKLDAVRQGHVVPIDDDLAGRWGPRVVDLVRSISDAVAKSQNG